MNRESVWRRAGGFTLLETMIAMSIFMIAIAMATKSFSRVGQAAAASAVCGNMHQNMRHAVDLMTRDLHAAKSVITAHDDYYFGVVVEGPGGDEYVYYLAHRDKLYRCTVHGGEVLAENIDTLGWSCAGLTGMWSLAPRMLTWWRCGSRRKPFRAARLTVMMSKL